MSAIIIAEAVLKYGTEGVSKGAGNRASMAAVKKLIKVLYAAAINRGDIGERTDQEWVASVMTNLNYKLEIFKDLGEEPNLIPDYQNWVVRVLNRNPLLERLYSWANQFLENKDNDSLMPVIIPMSDMEECKEWQGVVETFKPNFESLLYKFFLFNDASAYFHKHTLKIT